MYRGSFLYIIYRGSLNGGSTVSGQRLFTFIYDDRKNCRPISIPSFIRKLSAKKLHPADCIENNVAENSSKEANRQDLGCVHTWCPSTSARAPAQNGAIFRH